MDSWKIKRNFLVRILDYKTSNREAGLQIKEIKLHLGGQIPDE